MDYGVLIQRSWQLTRLHRFLWVLGLFATSTVGSCSPTSAGNGVQYRADSSDVERFFSPDLLRAFQQADPLLSRNIGLFFLAIVLLVLVFVLAFLAVSFVAQGGMATATAELALGREMTADSAWRTGLHLFWRYLLLWLLLIGLALAAALAVAIVIGVFVAVGMAAEGSGRTVVAVFGGLLGLLALIILLPLFIAASIVVAFAQRAVAVEQAGPWHALGVGLRLTRRRLGTAALAWLISIAISIAVGIAVVLVALVLLIPLGALGVAVFYAAGAIVSTPLVLYALVALVALLGALWLLGGVANAFFWNYWTLVYLYLTGRLTDRLEPPATTA